MITIDGQMGEGGGQILRSSLGLSMVTGRPVRIENIRAGRKKPGLMRQHLTCVRAAAEICNATVQGDALCSQILTFHPGDVAPGEYAFQIDSAGSTGLVFQTLLPALMQCDEESLITITGGTHNAWAPPADFLAMSFAGVLNRIGVNLDVQLERHGFYPVGRGKAIFHIVPNAGQRFPLNLPACGETHEVTAHVLLANLSKPIAEKELNRIAKKLPLPYTKCHWRDVDSAGPGNAIMIQAVRNGVTQVFSAFGARGKEGYKVADDVIDQFILWRDSAAAADEHLADQLLIPLALGAGGRYTTTQPSKHTLTNIDVIRHFLDAAITTEKIDDHLWRIDVRPG